MSSCKFYHDCILAPIKCPKKKKKMEPEILASNDNILLISLSGLSVYDLIDAFTYIDACCPPPRQPSTFLRESLSLFFSSFPSTLALPSVTFAI